MKRLMMALGACSMLLMLGAVQSFVVPTIVRSELKCRSDFFGRPLSGRCFRPLHSHGPLQAYVDQQDSSLNDSSNSFRGSSRRFLAEVVEIKSFQLFDPIQLFVVPRNSKSKNNNSTNRARARQMTMTSRRSRAFHQRSGYKQAPEESRHQATVKRQRPSRSHDRHAANSHGPAQKDCQTTLSNPSVPERSAEQVSVAQDNAGPKEPLDFPLRLNPRVPERSAEQVSVAQDNVGQNEPLSLPSRLNLAGVSEEPTPPNHDLLQPRKRAAARALWTLWPL
jgi:hypothetical protein